MLFLAEKIKKKMCLLSLPSVCVCVLVLVAKNKVKAPVLAEKLISICFPGQRQGKW